MSERVGYAFSLLFTAKRCVKDEEATTKTKERRQEDTHGPWPTARKRPHFDFLSPQRRDPWTIKQSTEERRNMGVKKKNKKDKKTNRVPYC